MHTEFLSWDDDTAIVENPVVNQGLTIDGALEALREPVLNLWTPVSQWSHQFDVSLFGLNPDAHHVMGVLYHVLAGVALWWALMGILKAKVFSFPIVVVVGLFWLHPVQVESWAWISERKDLLSALFIFLSIGAWIRWLDRGKRRLLSLFFLTTLLALMSKPIAIVLPVVLLALWWLRKGSGQGIVPQQKWVCLSFGLATLACCILVGVTLNIHAGRAEMAVLSNFTLEQRAQLGFSNYPRYLVKLFYPQGLSYFYPLPKQAPNGLMIAGILLMLTSAWFSFQWLKKKSVLALGPILFICFLAPTVGFIVSGESYGADRYGYIANVGVFLLLALGLERLRFSEAFQIVKVGSVALVLVFFTFLSFKQAKSWQNMLTLTEHALEQNENNYKAVFHQACWYQDQGDDQRFVELTLRTFNLRPDHQEAALILGRLAIEKQEFSKAEEYFSTHQNYWKNDQGSLEGRAFSRVKQGKVKLAVDDYKKLSELHPETPRYKDNLRELERL